MDFIFQLSKCYKFMKQYKMSFLFTFICNFSFIINSVITKISPFQHNILCYENGKIDGLTDSLINEIKVDHIKLIEMV